MQKMIINDLPDEGVVAEEGAAGIIEEVTESSKEEVKQTKKEQSDTIKDRHPEKRMKAAFKKFEDERLP